MNREDLNKQIIETIEQGIIILNSRNNITFVNTAAASMLGCFKKELLGTQLFEYLTDEDYKKIKDNIPVIKDDVIELQRIKLRKKDGSFLDADLVIKKLNPNHKSSLITIENVTTEKVKKPAALNKEEEGYKILFEKSSSGILYCDVNGNVVLINEQCVKFFGNTPAEFQGKNISEFLPDEIRNAALETIATKKYVEIEAQLKFNDKPFDYYVYFQPLMKTPGELYGVMIIFHEATQNKKIQKVLRESETRFRRLFEDIAQVPVQGYDQDHRVLFWNKASEAAYGYTKEEAMGQKLEDLIIPDPMYTDVYNAIEDFYNKDIPIPSGEIGLKRKDGSIVDMYSSHVIIKNYDGKKEMYCIDVDMSKRIEAEKQIALQARMLNAVGQSVIATDKEGNIIFLNDAAEKLYGWKRSEVLNKNLLFLLPPNEIKKQAEEFIRSARKGETWTGEFVAQKRGVPFIALGSNSPIFNSCGELIGIIGVSIDITDIKNKEKELKAAKEKAEEMSKVKSAFLANMSHELRTPLVGILGFSEILNQELEDGNHKSIAGSMLLSGKRLLSTLNAILDLAKIEANMMDLNYAEFQIITEVRCAIKIFEGLAAKKGLKMIVEEAEDFIVELDRNIFLQILENLLHNALKFTEKGEIRISIKKESGYFSLIVKDTGIGISKESQHLIFNEFRQVSEGYGRHFEGTGIGLTLTRRFVSLMHGVIYVESELNKGTIFTVRFPLRNIIKENSLISAGKKSYNGVQK